MRMHCKNRFQLLALGAVLLTTAIQPATITFAQARGAPQTQGAPQAQRGGQRAAAKPPTPMTLKQVVEQLQALRSSSRVEDLVSKAGVQFQSTPAVLDLLKQFGAGPRLLSMIPNPPPAPAAPAPPAPKVAGPLTIVCEPIDCMVAIEDLYEGPTNQSKKTVSGLKAGETNIQVFADGYEHLARRVMLAENVPSEQKFSLKRSIGARQDVAKVSLLKAITTLGGVDGVAELGNVEGDGTMQWMNSSKNVESWNFTFNKRLGRDISVTYKAPGGQCTASVLIQTTKQDCRGDLRNGGEKIAGQGTTLLLSYQLQDVIGTLLKRPLIASEADENRLESIDTKDSYVLMLGSDGFPRDLVYSVGNDDQPIHVQYSNYVKLSRGWYPSKISVGRLDSTPAWVFSIKSIRGRSDNR